MVSLLDNDHKSGHWIRVIFPLESNYILAPGKPLVKNKHHKFTALAEMSNILLFAKLEAATSQRKSNQGENIHQLKKRTNAACLVHKRYGNIWLYKK